MPTDNPYNDSEHGPIWAQGYQLGYDEPEVDHPAPVRPELAGVFSEGEIAGRDDRRSEMTIGPPAPPTPQGPPLDAPDQHAREAAGEVMLEVATHWAADAAFGAAGGLATLLVTVFQIPGDVQLHPLDPDWTGKADEWGTTYVAVCPEIHMQAAEGVTSDGYWAGAVRQSFADADSDKAAHGHASTLVAMCSLDSDVCGPVVQASP